MAMPAVLVVEDAADIARFLQLELTHEGYDVTTAADGRQGLEQALSGTWNVIVLDIMLPGLSGLELCRRIRAQSQVPILMLTAKDDLSDKVAGLDAGADDYLTKPFAIEELLARVRAQLRRSEGQQQAASSTALRVADLELDEATYVVRRAGRVLPLTKREFDLLAHLARHVGQVLTRDALLNAVWGYDFAGGSNVVDVYIRYVRSKVDAESLPPLIHTVRGVGYVLRSGADNGAGAAGKGAEAL
ncbi:MAG: response regulator transcription factor [Symbiobacteriia bacterium]